MIRSLIIASLLALLFGAGPSFAHRVPEGLTTIARNANTGAIEIVHRLHTHDAERALSELLQKPQLTLDTLEARAQLALYVESRFQIIDHANGEPVKLTLVGAELDGEYVLIFQESATPLPNSLSLRHDALRDVIPNQVNTVNISLDSQLRTLVFAEKDKWKALQLPR